MLALEREGIEPVLAASGLKYADLGVAPCKLYYRRRVLDMPLSDIPPDAPEKRANALRQARAKILEKAQRKFLFEFQELRAPGGLIVENGAVVGVNFSRTDLVDGQVRIVQEGAESARAPMTISSIGSIPEPIPGIPQKGEVYTYVDQKIGLLMDGPTAVFAAGNVLTGKGNIKDSLDNGTEIGTLVAETYLGLSNEELKIAEGARKDAAASGEKIAGALSTRPRIAPGDVANILQSRPQASARRQLRRQLPRVARQGNAPRPALKIFLNTGCRGHPAQGSVKATACSSLRPENELELEAVRISKINREISWEVGIVRRRVENLGSHLLEDTMQLLHIGSIVGIERHVIQSRRVAIMSSVCRLPLRRTKRY